jgi:predicted DNA-binding WGR domain protein
MPTDDTTQPCSISLRAVNPARNIARHYQIELSRDLFGLWVVDCRWGRIGTVGRARRFLPRTGTGTSLYAGLIRRRIAARRRIGVPYQMFAD